MIPLIFWTIWWIAISFATWYYVFWKNYQDQEYLFKSFEDYIGLTMLLLVCLLVWPLIMVCYIIASLLQHLDKK
jgi:hypothetical protein